VTQWWKGPDEVPLDLGRAVTTVGFFDGVHRGHHAMLARARGHADHLGLPLVVVTFDPHPAAVVRPDAQPPLLATLEQRVLLLREAGADGVLVVPFTRALSHLTPEEFAHAVLVDRLHSSVVVVGENFRFGHRAAGDVDTLAEIGVEHDFVVDAVPLAAGSGGAYSSTFVRGLVAAGDVATAAEALQRPHRVEGVVVAGDRRGRELGYPTANLDVVAHTAVPADGVYAARLLLHPYDPDQEVLPAAVSVGTNPTFDGVERRVEAYVLDRDDLDLYGRRVALDFVDRIRGMLRFNSVDDLVAAMADDVDRVRARLRPGGA
jgi:riboflavin kinase/FMN adenylyltransferase